MKQLFLLLVLFGIGMNAQSNSEALLPENLKEMSYNEYLGFVKKYQH